MVYDNSETAKERALQCTKHNLKGVSILLNQDDDAGICEETKFPLLNAVVDVFEKYGAAECVAVEQVEDEKKSVEKDRFSNELTRLEKAVESIEKSTGLLQKIVSFLFRTMNKAVDLLISLTGKQTVDNPKDADADLENGETGSHEGSDNLAGVENEKSSFEPVRQEEIDAIKDEMIENAAHVDDILQKDVVQHQISDVKEGLGVV